MRVPRTRAQAVLLVVLFSFVFLLCVLPIVGDCYKKRYWGYSDYTHSDHEGGYYRKK